MLHLTKVAFGISSLDHLNERLAARAAQGPVFLTTRNMPKRHEEVAGQGSLYWIMKHHLVARSPILGFGEAEDGRTAIFIEPVAIRVEAQPRRAHQGWRYLEDKDAPRDLANGAADLAALPADPASELSSLALI
jgi:hypothetical protein